MAKIRAIARCPDEPAREIDPAAAKALLADSNNLLWLDIEDPTDTEIGLLRREFAFHELALEDALTRGQRPKVDDYHGCYFIVFYTVSVLPDRLIATHELHAFWGANYLVTLHQGPIGEIADAIDRWAASEERHRLGVAFQTYTLFDTVVDGYFPAVDAVADQIEELGDRALDAKHEVIREVFRVRRNLIDARRHIAPSRDVLNELIRRDVPIFPEELVPYLADVYDHAIRALDALDLNRELLASAMESHLSAVSNQLNMTMRTMTALTIGLMVPTLIAGIYGMNYRLAPGNEFEYGFHVAVGGMALLMVLILFIFRRVGWL
jgi:magnesium transporter